jgi:hypothetical protein
MGHHYVPQRYLRNFQIPAKASFIWLFDKRGGRPREASIEKVAQIRGFYDPAIEIQLNTDVELPGTAVIEKLRNAASINDSERATLTIYIGTMMMRVPERRQRAHALIPKVLAESRQRVRERLIAAAEQTNADPELLSRRLAENDRIVADLAADPPAEVIAQIRAPWPTHRMLQAIYDMDWRILTAHGPSFYATSDNPVFFFRGYGIGRPESELTFPLSTKCVLHGCHKRDCGEVRFLHATEQFVREVNRRMVSGATRLVFYHEKAEWLARMSRKDELRLDRVVW